MIFTNVSTLFDDVLFPKKNDFSERYFVFNWLKNGVIHKGIFVH